MARVQHVEVFVTNADKNTCLSAARREILRLGGTLERGGDSEIKAKFGSGARTRLLGGIFVSGSTLPVRARVSVRPELEASQVSVTAEEAMGIGSLAGMGDKFQARCAAVALQLRQALETKVGHVPRAQESLVDRGRHASPDVVSQLERLNVLHQRGALTDQEYEATKAQLLRGP